MLAGFPLGRVRRGLFLGGLLALASFGGASIGSAQTPDPALAETLFQEGKKLLDQKRYAEACPKLAESLRLDPGASGTLFTLAYCHENEGKLASAWAEYADALSAARRDKRSDRETLAKERIALLEPRLSKLTVTVPEGARVPGLVVERDGREVPGAAFGVAVPVDGGKHVVSARAPGRTTWSIEVTLAAEKEEKTVAVPPLAQGAAPPASSTAAPPPRSAAPPAASSPAATRDGEGAGSRRTIGWVSLGAGAVAIGVGAVFGLRAIDKAKTSKDLCPDGKCPTPEGVTAHDDAAKAATVSNVAMGVGLVGVGVGAFLLATSPKRETGARVTPYVGRTGGGLVAGGSF